MHRLCLSYPYSEDDTKPTQYMNTRCPAWCDRILMSHTAQEIIQKVSQCLLHDIQYPHDSRVYYKVSLI